MRNEITNPNEVILIRRDALDLLLLISRQLKYPDLRTEEEILDSETDIVEFA